MIVVVAIARGIGCSFIVVIVIAQDQVAVGCQYIDSIKEKVKHIRLMMTYNRLWRRLSLSHR